VTAKWALHVPRAEAAAIARLRASNSIEVCEAAGEVWLRGSELDDALTLQIRSLPAVSRYDVLPDRQLIAHGNRVPCGLLPEGDWLPLRQWVAVAFPPVGWPGELETQVAIELVRSDAVRPTAALLTTLVDLLAWVATAPQVRLDPLRMAACRDGRVFVHGQPLPPLRGQRFTLDDGIAVPAGWTWRPAVDAGVLRAACRLDTNDVALMQPQRNWELIKAKHFVRLTRSAVRETAEVHLDG